MNRYVPALTVTLGLIAFCCDGLRANDDPSKAADRWIDMLTGEQISQDDLLDDLAHVDIIYLGERHSIERHHNLQQQFCELLTAKKMPWALGLEQMESDQQDPLDRFNLGMMDFDQLAQSTNWAKRWHNFENYAAIVRAAQLAKSPVLALNAKAETIHQIARGGGVDKLSTELRRQLPQQMQLSDPVYEKLLTMQMMVHMAAKPEMLRPMIEAQIARDEAMAEAIAKYWNAEKTPHRKIVVLCGSGHVAFGLGLPARVQKRLPKSHARIVVFSESGELKLSPAERAQARDVTITHEQLRELQRPLADYIVIPSKCPQAQ